MTKASEIKIREPNTLIEAGQRLSREELIVWIWSLLKAKPKGQDNTVLSAEEIEEYKRRQEIPLMTSEFNLEELQALFPQYFGGWKPYYYRKLLKRLESKIAFEVKLDSYLRTLKELGYEFVIKRLDIPENPKEVIYFGISAVVSVTLKKDNTLEIVFSPQVTPLLLELKKWYTTYDFLDIVKLNSKHSIVLYRLIKEKLGLKQNPFSLSIEELNRLFGVNYKSWKSLRENVVDPAVEQINKNTKYRIGYRTIRKGRGGKVSTVIFYVEETNPCQMRAKLETLPLILESLIKSFRQGGEEITKGEFAKVLLSLRRLNPAVALWFLLHYPEGEARLYAWKHIEMTERNLSIGNADRFLMSLIKDKNPQLDWLLDQRTKDLIRKELEKLVQTNPVESLAKELLSQITEKVKGLNGKYNRELEKTLGVKDLNDYLLKMAQKREVENLKEVLLLIDQLLDKQWQEQLENL